MDEKTKMLSEKLYRPDDVALKKAYKATRDWLEAFNQTHYNDFDARERMARMRFGRVGKNFVINKPFHCDYGENIYVGDDVYLNVDCLFLDVNTITVGDRVMFAPRVSVLTATHPIDKDVRNSGLEYGLKVTIEDDVWIGGNVTINPGVTIGKGTIIGSGSVVTKSMPNNVIAAGNPCRVIRKITEDDKRYWQAKQRDYFDI